MPPVAPPVAVEVVLDAQGRRTCGARTRAGGACAQPAMDGQQRCRLHGGASPQAKRAARDRLADEADSSIGRLVHLRDHAASEAVRAKAATTLLEMAGYGRYHRHEVELSTTEARARLVQRLLELRAGAIEAPATNDARAGDAVIDAEVVEDDD